MSGNMQITIITLNVNGMNSPIKWKQIAEWISSQKPTISCLQGIHMRQVDTHRFKMKGWNKIYWASTKKRKTGVAILISDKIKAKLDLIKRDREGNYISIKCSRDNEEISVLNIYAPNGIAFKFLKEKLAELEEEIDSNTILVGDLNLPLSDLDKSNQKINKKEVREVNEILEKIELIYMWRIVNRDKRIHLLFSSSWYIHKD